MNPRSEQPSVPRRSGFTLIEIVVVIVLILLLLWIVTPAYLQSRTKNNITITRTEVRELQKAWAEYNKTYKPWTSSTNFVMDANACRILAGANPSGVKFMNASAEDQAYGMGDAWDSIYRVEYLRNIVRTGRVYQTRVYFANRSRSD